MPWNPVKWHDCPFFSFSDLLCDDSCQGCPCPISGIPGGAAGSPACLSPLHHHTAGTCPQGKMPILTRGLPAQPSSSQIQLGKANRTMIPTQRETVGSTVWVADLGSSSSPESSGGIETAITKCCILQAWHLVQSSPNAEENALHFLTLGSDSPPLI